MAVKLDKVSQQKQLRLLKQKMKKRSSSSPIIPSSSHLSQDSTQSSSPSISSHNSAWSFPKTTNTMRRINASRFIGRRSHTLKLAARSSLNTSPKIWNRKVIRRSAQIPTSALQNLQKLKSIPPTHAAFDDSSSESVLSDNNILNHKSTPCMISDDSSGSISPPQTYSPKPAINTTLPSHDGSSPHTLIPTQSSSSSLSTIVTLPKTSFNTNINTKSSSSVPAPIHSLKHLTKHKISPNNLIPKQSKPKKAQIITDINLVDAYLKDEASLSSAIGVNVGKWSDTMDNGEEIRKAIVEDAKQPIVEPKDEWDLALDSGAAYPHKSKKTKNPFEDFNRNEYKNKFQTTQSDHIAGNHKLQRSKKKKGGYHNKNRYHNRQRRKMMES